MKRYFNIFLLNCQSVFHERGRSFVWFLISLATPLIMILFWHGAANAATRAAGWDFSAFSLYYLLIVITGSFLVSHCEENIAYVDIQKGELSNYLVKPIPYYWIKFFGEIPYRILQGSFGVVTLAILIALLGQFTVKPIHIPTFFLTVIVLISAYFLCYTYKVILGISALWLTEINGVQNISEIILLLTGGFILPLSLLPDAIQRIFEFFPFPYIAYYPVEAVMGKLSPNALLQVIGIQFIWLSLAITTYHILWNSGQRKFTAVGR